MSSTSVYGVVNRRSEEAHDGVPEPLGLVDRPPHELGERRDPVRGHEARDVARRAAVRRSGRQTTAGRAHRPRNLRRRPGSVQRRWPPVERRRPPRVDRPRDDRPRRRARRDRRDRVHRHRLGTRASLDDGIQLVVHQDDATLATHGRLRPQDAHASRACSTEIAAATRDVAAARARGARRTCKQHVPSRESAPLCGNSIGMDRRFLASTCPSSTTTCTTAASTCRRSRSCAGAGIPAIYRKRPGKAEQHRALGDIRESIEELRYYRAEMFVAAAAEARTPRPRRTGRRAGRARQPSSSRSAPSSVVTECSRAEWPMRPMRQPLPASVAEPAADLDVEAGAQLAAHLGVVDAVGQPDRRELREPSLLGEQPEAELRERVLQQRADAAGGAPTTPRALPRAAHRGRRAARRASRSARCGGSGARCRRSRRSARGRGTTTAPGVARLRTRSTARAEKLTGASPGGTPRHFCVPE